MGEEIYEVVGDREEIRPSITTNRQINRHPLQPPPAQKPKQQGKRPTNRQETQQVRLPVVLQNANPIFLRLPKTPNNNPNRQKVRLPHPSSQRHRIRVFLALPTKPLAVPIAVPDAVPVTFALPDPVAVSILPYEKLKPKSVQLIRQALVDLFVVRGI